MISRLIVGAWIVAISALGPLARAQDVPGIEICTVEKTMERRTSCLQSNIEFLQKTMAKLALDHQQKLDAANRQIDALKATIMTLQKTVDELKAVSAKVPDSAKKGDTSKDTAARDAAARDATTKDGTGKDVTTKEGGK